MATTVVKTIGTGGDYSTLQAWEDACPANLVTADQVWQGQLKNQEFVSGSPLLTISGTTVDSTRYVELTTEAGASFADHANKATNALRYNASNGAGIRWTGTYGTAITISQSYTRISKLQITATGSSNAAACLSSGSIDYVDHNQCIFEGKTTATTVSMVGSNSRLRNSLVVARHASAGSIVQGTAGTNIYNSTLVSTAGTATNGFLSNYGTAICKNVYVGNVTNATAGSASVTKTTSFTSVSGPPSGWSAAAFSTATFESITDGSHDLRLKTGSALIDAGTTESTYAANDVIGTARSGTWDVGAWEVPAAGGASATFTIKADDVTFSGGGTVSPICSFTAVAADATFSGGASTGAASANFATTTADSTFSGAAVGDTSSGILTTPVLKNNTGTVLASETGATAYVYNPTTGALIVKKTSQVTDGSGVMVIADPLIIASTLYRVVVVLASGAEGMERLTAA